MLNVLVTGGAGYIGSHVVKGLLRQGYHPVVYDNLQTGHRKAARHATFIKGDLADRSKLKEALDSYSIQAVMHFAADCLVGESVEKPAKYFNNNVRNGIQLLEIMEEYGINKIIFSSSAAVFGEPKKTPVVENHPCSPMNPYGETKWIFEKVLRSFSQQRKLNYVSLRYFNAAGADPEGELGEDHSPETHLIPLVIRAALTGNSVSIYGTDYDTPDGTCVRDYIHVTDLTHAHILALQRLELGGGSAVYNLGNGNGYSVKEVIETAREVTGRKIVSIGSARRPGDPARLVASSKKIGRELGWKPQYPDLETIIETAWHWHRKHPNGYRDEL